LGGSRHATEGGNAGLGPVRERKAAPADKSRAGERAFWGSGSMRVVADVAAGACALLFMAAVLGKLDSWPDWSRLTKDFPGPTAFGNAVRVVVPAVEASIVVASFAVPTVGLAAGAVVLTCFAVAVWVLGRQLAGRECNCFGAIAPATISPRLAVRNAGLAIALLASWVVSYHERAQALSLGKVIATVLGGAIALTCFQYRRLRHATLTATDPQS
jgi:Methylamine utilisation protein MauE